MKDKMNNQVRPNTQAYNRKTYFDTSPTYKPHKTAH